MLFLIFWACEPGGLVIEDEQSYSNIGRVAPSEDTQMDTILRTEQGPYGPFGVGSYWRYASRSIDCDELPPYECDTTYSYRTIRLEKDTIIDGVEWFGYKNDWYRMEGDVYYFLTFGRHDVVDGIFTTRYLNLQVPPDTYWFDTVTLTGSPSIE